MTDLPIDSPADRFTNPRPIYRPPDRFNQLSTDSLNPRPIPRSTDQLIYLLNEFRLRDSSHHPLTGLLIDRSSDRRPIIERTDGRYVQ